jgi:hypothetical protein
MTAAAHGNCGSVTAARFLFLVSPRPDVVGRAVFYNHSSFDGNDASANASDDAAIDPSKAALPPGQTASYANVTSYDKGINGIAIDVTGRLPLTALAGLAATVGLEIGPGGESGPTTDAPRPAAIGVRPGAGANGSDRITLVWADGAISNTWLRVTVPALPDFGLAAPDVFSFGNLIGETGDGGASGWRVSALDLGAAKRALNSTATLGSITDFNRDGRTNALDLGIQKRSLNKSLSPPPAQNVAALVSPRALSPDGPAAMPLGSSDEILT